MGRYALSLVAEEGWRDSLVTSPSRRHGSATRRDGACSAPLAVSPEAAAGYRQRADDRGAGPAAQCAARGAVLVGDPTYYRRFGFQRLAGPVSCPACRIATLALPLEPGVEPAGELFLHPALCAGHAIRKRAGDCSPALASIDAGSVQLAFHCLALEDFDDVALANVVVVFESHAAFWPEMTSFTSSLKRFSVFSVPSWITTLSRSRRTPAERRATPFGDQTAGDLADAR